MKRPTSGLGILVQSTIIGLVTYKAIMTIASPFLPMKEVEPAAIAIQPPAVEVQEPRTEAPKNWNYTMNRVVVNGSTREMELFTNAQYQQDVIKISPRGTATYLVALERQKKNGRNGDWWRTFWGKGKPSLIITASSCTQSNIVRRGNSTYRDFGEVNDMYKRYHSINLIKGRTYERSKDYFHNPEVFETADSILVDRISILSKQMRLADIAGLAEQYRYDCLQDRRLELTIATIMRSRI